MQRSESSNQKPEKETEKLPTLFSQLTDQETEAYSGGQRLQSWLSGVVN